MARCTGLLVALAACSSPSSGGDDVQQMQEDAAVVPMIDARPACLPLGECDWLESYQRHIVGALAGGKEISPGVTLVHRASVSARNATRQFLVDELTALGFTPQRQDYTSGQQVGANIIATLDATAGGGTLLVVGAHFDGVPQGPAAADNGTGVAIVLALARYLRDVPARTHPIAFALFDQEELGLVGSREYAKMLTPATVKGVHIYDMVSFDGDGDHAVELWSPSPALEAAYQMQAVAAGTPVAAVMFEASDHQAFLERGLPTTGVSEEFVGGDATPHYHKATDTYANVSFEHLGRVTRLAMLVLDAEAR
jgi:hypothetical protein